MFGYVTPYIPELKVKDYEKFKAYYCGLCKSIKYNIGNVPRASLNYDMTFLAILLDGLYQDKSKYNRSLCMIHPTRKKTWIEDNDPLKYAAFCNVSLVYYKLLDNINDDKSAKDIILYKILKQYIKKFPEEFKNNMEYIKKSLQKLSKFESDATFTSFDGICEPFSSLTAFIVSNYSKSLGDELYNFGYNLGKWIYIIDAFDDLKDDMENKNFNLLNRCFNTENLCYNEFYKSIKDKVDFILGTCASQCMEIFKKLPIMKNQELIYNILQYGLLEKMDKVFKRGVYKNEKSL